MSRPGSLADIRRAVSECKTRCEALGIPFHADALAAALGISYETLVRCAEGKEVGATTAAVLAEALQECTASVVSFALSADPKHHALYMWYLRNRGGFADKIAPSHGDGVTFIGEGRI